MLQVYAIGNPFGLDHTLTQVWWGGVERSGVHDVKSWCSALVAIHQQALALL